MKVLVTGAAGFIGMHVSKLLLECGDAVVGVDRFWAGWRIRGSGICGKRS